MSVWDSIFGSQRSREGERLYGGEQAGYDQLLKDISGSSSEYSGINTTGDVSNRFGLSTDVSGVFNPQRKNLASSFARMMKGRAAASGRSATPEFGNLQAQQSYFSSLEDLGSKEAGAKIGRQDMIANLLDEIMGKKDAFGERKRQATGGALNSKGNAIDNYLSSQSGSSIFDDIIGAGSLGLQTAGALGWKPFH